jgi:hypothetical protein
MPISGRIRHDILVKAVAPGGAAAPLPAPMLRLPGKQSFFEKKDQKTFIYLRRDSTEKSFLLLFSGGFNFETHKG